MPGFRVPRRGARGPFNPVTISTWERLATAGDSPIAGKPHAAEIAANNIRDPLLVGTGGKAAEKPPMRMNPVRPIVDVHESTEGVFVALRCSLDLSPILGQPPKIGSFLSEAIRLAQDVGDVVGVAIDREGICIEVKPDNQTMNQLAKKRAALQARLEVLLR